MVEVNRKTFLRSVEAIMSIIILMSFYNIITQNVDRPEYALKADPYKQVSEAWDLLDNQDITTNLLKTHNLKELNSYLSLIHPPNIGVKMESRYYEPIRIKNNNDYDVERTIRIPHNAPRTINHDSITIYDENNILPIKPVNNWYQTIISITNNQSTPIIGQPVLLEDIKAIVSSTQDLNETSIQAYYNNEKTIIDVDSINYNNPSYDANITLKTIIPRIEAYETGEIILLYAEGLSEPRETYASLSNPKIISYSSTLPAKSGRIELLINISLEAGEEKELIINYEINTNTEQSYYEITSYDNTNIEYDTPTKYYTGTYPEISEEPGETTNVQKNVVANDKIITMNIKTWFYE